METLFMGFYISALSNVLSEMEYFQEKNHTMFPERANTKNSALSIFF